MLCSLDHSLVLKQVVCFTMLKGDKIVIVYKSVAVETKLYSKFNEANVIV